MATVNGPKSLLLPQLPDGSDNPLFALINYADLVGIKIESKAENASFGPISDYEIFNLSMLQQVVAFGCEVSGFPAWVELIDASASIPEYLDARPTIDENGDPIVLDPLSWSDWHDEFHTPTVVDDKTYVASDSMGTFLDGSVLTQLMTDGFTLKTKPEMQEIVVENSPPLEN